MSRFAYIAAKFIIPSNIKTNGLRLLFDVEADGLLDTATKLHCIVVANLDRNEVSEYGPEKIDAALEHLGRADYLAGHNIQSYDLLLLEQLRGWRPKPGCTILDTLTAGRLILPHLSDLDDQAAAMGDPPLAKLRGRYSLEAWGVRLGIPKVGVDIEDWSVWTPELQSRCVGDVAICKKLWQFLQPDGYSQQAIELEHRVAPICDRITADGVPFHRVAAERLFEQWESELAGLKAKLQAQFPETNLSSRQQIGALLEARGWIPEKRTEKTRQPVINDEVLETIPALFPEFTGLAEYDLLRRRIAQLATGKQAWLKHIGDDGRIHGGLVSIGTPHSRAKHLAPNLAQVPNAKKGGAYAAECRALFRHPGDWVFVTCDQANLQDRAFAHHLAEFDGGAYAQAFLAGLDQHWQNAIALELVPVGTERNKDSKIHTAIREGAKHFRYGFLFGAGAARCGEILAETVRAVQQIAPTCTAPTDGKGARDRFIAATPGLQHLRNRLEAQVARHQWLLGLDGRRVPTLAQYTALNYALASIEAIVCKRWLANVYDELCTRFKYGWDGDLAIVLWVHDEIAACCRPEIAEQVGEILVKYAVEAGAHYGLKVPLAADYKIGRDWAGTPLESAASAESITAPDAALSIVPEAEARQPEPDIDAGDELGRLDGDDDASSHRRGTGANHNRDNQDRLAIPIPADGIGVFVAVEAPLAAAGHDVAGPAIPPLPAAPGAEESVGIGADGQPPWATPVITEVPPGSAEFAAILASLSAEERAIVWPPKPNGNGAATSREIDKILCPFHDDRNPSLQVYADGHYHCYGCGAHGEVEELAEHVSAPVAPPAPQTDTLERGIQLWQAGASIHGTLAERYLVETRRLDLTVVPDLDAVLRFHPRCPFDGATHPCLIALFRDVETDEAAGIHRIALTADAEKIDRMMLGSWPRPRAIKLRPVGEELLTGEGIETSIAGEMKVRWRSALWALGSAGAIERFPVIANVAKLGILVDRDGNGVGGSSARLCADRWYYAHRKVVLLTPQKIGADFNDLIKERDPGEIPERADQGA
jgi:DNA polymerase I-like protein with 3'-5' exonuclease and polymerase domains